METQIDNKFNRSFKYMLLTLALFLTAIMAVFAYTAYNYFKPNPDFLSVTGTYTSEETNEIATLTLNFRSKNPIKEKAEEDVNNKTMKAMEIIKKLGIEEKDVKTTYFNTARDIIYNYDNNQNSTYTEGDWITNQSIDVNLNKEKSKLSSQLISEISSLEIEVSGPNYTIDTNFNDSEILKLAFEDAKRKAEELAKISGRRLGEANSISENSYYGDETYGTAERSMSVQGGMGGGSAPSMPIGSSKVTRSVYVTFDLE